MSPVSKGRKRKPNKKARRPHVVERPSAAPDASTYTDDLSPLMAQAGVERAVDRRKFVLPFHAATIGGEHFAQLNPADPDERQLLIEGEHPEYHEALADPSRDEVIDGVNPRMHLALHEIVANQLWDDEPSEAWQAARRLRDQGVDRHNILHGIMAVAAEHLYPTLVKGEPFDSDAYRQALGELGHTPGRRSRTTYQVKISIVGSDPVIWRRLSLPGDTGLDVLHEAIQVAFGWENVHLHEFRAGDRRFGNSFGGMTESVDERRVTLAEVAPLSGTQLYYTYDFGDDWVHDIVVEAIEPAEDRPPVVCLAAEHAGPPEDSGGIYRYQHVRDADSDAVDLDAISAALGGLRARTAH